MKSERPSECSTRRETASSPFNVKIYLEEMLRGNPAKSESELSEVLRTLGDVLSEEETEEFIAQADLDGDGNYSNLIH